MGPEPGHRRCPFLARRLADPELRARVEAAERLGISLRRFDGWEPVETTRHHHDRRGRLVRSVTVREPEFDDDDRAWFIALAYWRDTRCPLCGGDIRDCTAPEDQVTVAVPPPRRCQATDALLDERQRYKDSPKPGALLWRSELRRR